MFQTNYPIKSNINLMSVGKIKGRVAFQKYLVENVGDVNDDGFNDIIIADPSYNHHSGISFIVFGGHALPEVSLNYASNYQVGSKNVLTITAENSGDWSGYSVCSKVNFNGDAFNDIIIGAPEANQQHGIVYVIYGNRFPVGNIDLKQFESNFNQGFKIYGNAQYPVGEALLSIGDINNDTYDDFLIGDTRANIGKGCVYLIFGKNISLNINLADEVAQKNIGIFCKNDDGYTFPYNMDIIRNYNGDKNVVVETKNVNSGSSYTYLISKNELMNFYNKSFVSNFVEIFHYIDTSNSSLSAIGDINNDGVEDFVLASTNANINRANLDVLYGNSSTLAKDEDKSISFEVDSEGQFGYSIIKNFDINGDGVNDFVVGAPAANQGLGKIYIFCGSKTGASLCAEIGGEAPRLQSALALLYIENFYGNSSNLVVGSLGDYIFQPFELEILSSDALSFDANA